MKFRYVLLIIAAAAALAYAQEPNPRVTLTTKASTVDKVVAEIAKQTGAKIDAAPSISREVVLVAVTDVALEDLLTRLADVTSGEWRAGSDGIRYLSYDDSLFRKRAREANAQRAENLRKSLAQSLKQAAEMEAEMKKAQETIAKGGGGEGEEQGAEGEKGEFAPEINFPWMSQDTFVQKVVARIDPFEIVGIGDARIVFSSNPTRMQRRLPNVTDIISEMIREHNKLAAEIEKNKKESAEEDPQTVEEKAREQQMEQVFGGMWQREDKPITTPPAKVLLVVRRGEMFSSGTAELVLYDAAGKRLYSTSTSLELSEDTSSMGEFIDEAMPEGQEAPPKPVDTTKPIEFSAETQEMMKVFNMNAMNTIFTGAGPTLSDSVMNMLKQPDVYDPLSFGPSDSLAFVAKDRNLDVVASLPDSITGMSDLMLTKGLTVGAFIQGLQDNASLTIDTKDGWFTVRPFDPESAKFYRVNRVSLRKLIASGEKGTPSMDDLAAYALENESPMKTELVMPYLTLYAPSVFADMMMGTRGWSALRLYGTLSPSQRDVLRGSGGFALGTLTPGQRSHAEMLLFGPETSLEVVDPSKPQDELPEFMKMAGALFGNNSGKDFRSEPTEVMPSGLPSQGTLSGALSTKPIMSPAKGLMSKIGFDASMLAMFQFAMSQPEAAGEIPDFGGMKLGSRTTLEMLFTVAPNVRQTERLSTDAASNDATTYAIDNLPPVMRAAVELEKAKLKKLGMFGGGG
jgi:hypothetical protein